jgi:hypothetical protein
MTPTTKKMTRIRNGLKIGRNLHQHLMEILRDISRLLKNAPAYRRQASAALSSSFVVAAYVQVRLTPQDFGSLASGHF